MSILSVWYEYDCKFNDDYRGKKTSGGNAKEFLRKILGSKGNELFPKKETKGYEKGYMEPAKIEQDVFHIDGDSRKKTYNTLKGNIIKGTDTLDKKAIEKLVSLKYKEWELLPPLLAREFEIESVKKHFSYDRARKMHDFFNTIYEANEKGGKKDLAEGLYNCVYLIFTSYLPAENEDTFKDSMDAAQYYEYSDIFHKYGRYSFQSNLILQDLAKAGNPYAKFDVAQMYYYGKEVVDKPAKDKTYELYEELYQSGWRYPLFLWARADFIIAYYDNAINGEDQPFKIPSLDEKTNSERFKMYKILFLDLVDAEKRGCGAASNLIGNILDDKAIKDVPINYTGEYKRIKSILEQAGTYEEHYFKGARNGSAYSYYHLYKKFLKQFIFEGNGKDLNRALLFLEEAAKTDNERAINESALFSLKGVKKRVEEIAIKEYEYIEANDNCRSVLSEENNNSVDLLSAYRKLNKVYETSIRRSGFKWPVINLIQSIYHNPDVYEQCIEKISDKDERDRLLAKVNNIDSQIKDLQDALDDYESRNGKDSSIISELNKSIEKLEKMKIAK